jgi:hypothetical protein
MFAYLVILFEVILLSFSFWYVFVRQPKPVNYDDFFPKGRDPWGVYARQSNRKVGKN